MTAATHATRTPAVDWATAVHEAGHAVAVIACGGTVSWATILPRGIDAGSVEHGGVEAVVERLAVSEAGGLAAALYATDFPGMRDGDRERAARIPADATTRADARDHARLIVSVYGRAVQEIARRLVARRTLPGDEIHEVFRQCRPSNPDRRPS